MARRPAPAPGHGPDRGLWWRLENFGLYLLWKMVFPLSPLGLELWFQGSLSDRAVILAASMYAISHGTSSKSRFLMSLMLVGGVGYAVAYGSVIGQGIPPAQARNLAIWGIIGVLLIHGIERLIRHVFGNEGF